MLRRKESTAAQGIDLTATRVGWLEREKGVGGRELNSVFRKK